VLSAIPHPYATGRVKNRLSSWQAAGGRRHHRGCARGGRRDRRS
jgi:hypothetical protein